MGTSFSGNIKNFRSFKIFLSTIPNPNIYSLDFDGQYNVDLGSNNLPSNNFTFEYWFKLATNNGGYLGGYGRGYPGEKCFIYVDTTTVSLESYGSPNPDEWFISINTNEFNHIAVRDDGSNSWRIFLNGSDLGTKSQSNTIDLHPSNHGMGYHRQQDNDPFNGLIHEYRLWNERRTQTQIQNNMNKTLNGDETNLVSYYKIDEGQGSTLTDYAGNNDGTINGAIWVEDSP